MHTDTVLNVTDGYIIKDAKAAEHKKVLLQIVNRISLVHHVGVHLDVAVVVVTENQFVASKPAQHTHIYDSHSVHTQAHTHRYTHEGTHTKAHTQAHIHVYNERTHISLA
eukprot:m.1449891 g.1449891  ORF g.1449891 m.1449891 type:complete len:110 (-) comp25115_c1_seq17:2401-2730(-)